MDRATYEAQVFGQIINAVMNPKRVGPLKRSTLPHVRECEDGTGCRWEADYTYRIEEDDVEATITTLRFVTDGPEFLIPLNAVAPRFIADMEWEIAETIAAEELP
jgi:hypothetical protein